MGKRVRPPRTLAYCAHAQLGEVQGRCSQTIVHVSRCAGARAPRQGRRGDTVSSTGSSLGPPPRSAAAARYDLAKCQPSSRCGEGGRAGGRGGGDAHRPYEGSQARARKRRALADSTARRLGERSKEEQVQPVRHAALHWPLAQLSKPGREARGKPGTVSSDAVGLEALPPPVGPQRRSAASRQLPGLRRGERACLPKLSPLRPAVPQWSGRGRGRTCKLSTATASRQEHRATVDCSTRRKSEPCA